MPPAADTRLQSYSADPSQVNDANEPRLLGAKARRRRHRSKLKRKRSPEPPNPVASEDDAATNAAANHGDFKAKQLPTRTGKPFGSAPLNDRLPQQQQQQLQTAADSLRARRLALIPIRRALPIWKHATEIRQALRAASVLVLAGETGCGKSTQLPQMLLTESWCRGCVAVTQPRRVAAITLAGRVAEEMGSTLGKASCDSLVGYSVRFDRSMARDVRIKFLTEGMLLQEMLLDPALRAYSVVVVDEVHERSVNVDLLLGLLRNLLTVNSHLREGQPLKIVVMSATADTDRLISFFKDGFATSDDINYESDSTWSGISTSDDELTSNKVAITPSPRGLNPPNSVKINGTSSLSTEKVASCFIQGRQYPVSIMYTPEPAQDLIEAALKSVFQIHIKEPLPGDILVFLTGQDTIESLQRLLNMYGATLSLEVPKLLVLPLFAALPHAAQHLIFQPAPPRTRKVILATNIAETSVTVPGVRFVIDSGKAKVKEFKTRLGLETLLSKPISKSSSIQRKGRAGREGPGICYRLYTEKDYLKLNDLNKPEIQRCDLAAALLDMKARGISDVFSFPLLDPPARDAIERALIHLYQLGALTPEGRISTAGSQMARLPLSPSLSRVLVAAISASTTATGRSTTHTGLLADVIDVIAALSVDGLFPASASAEHRVRAATARASLVRSSGDHMTMLTAVRGYESAGTGTGIGATVSARAARAAWADAHGVSRSAMSRVLDVRAQLRRLVGGASTEADADADVDPARPASAADVLRCLLAGFAAQTAVLMPDGSYRTVGAAGAAGGHLKVAIHPSSVLFAHGGAEADDADDEKQPRQRRKRRPEAIVFTEWVFTNKSYARGVSAVELAWVEEALLKRGEP